MISVFCESLAGSDSKMRSSTTGGGSTGRRSADAICDRQSVNSPSTRSPDLAQQRILTLRSCAACSCPLRLLHHAQFVCKLFAFTGDPADRVLSLIMRRHDGWSVGHLQLLFPRYPAGRSISQGRTRGQRVDLMSILPQRVTYNPEFTGLWTSADLCWWMESGVLLPQFPHISRWKDF